MSGGERTGLDIMKELYELTTRIITKLDDMEHLVAGIEERQMLMDEYDLYRSAHPDEDATEARSIAQRIIVLDKKIYETVSASRDQTRTDIANTQNQQRVLGYINKAMSASGSYMDYKK